MSVKVEKVALHVPDLEEVAQVLQSGLTKTFSEVHVSVVECPDLTLSPFKLAAKGICGSPRILDVGGVPNLVPTVKRDKIYNVDKVAELAELPGAFLIGAGAGPFEAVGVNSEMMANVRTTGGKETATNGTRVSLVNTQDNSCQLCAVHKGSRDFALMANLLASEGKSGKVIEIRAKNRIGADKVSFVDTVRFLLRDRYGDRPVGLGGAFALLHGKANIHVMPAFRETPFLSDEDVNNWLRYYDVQTPFVALGVCFSHDPGYNLREEHFHGYNDVGEGGHYHYDVTAAEADYLAYFSVADYLFRIDNTGRK